jgi:hypothetical protein
MKINYMPSSIPLTRWQELIDEFRRETKAPAECAFRIDGTQFSTAGHFGGFNYNGHHYHIAHWETGELLAVRLDFVGWLIRKEEPKKPQAKKAVQGVLI